MGFWNNLLMKLTGSGSSVAEPSYSRYRADRDDDGGVAVLDRPSTDRLGAYDSTASETDAPRWWEPEVEASASDPASVRLELSTEARAVESHLISHFDGHDLSLPTLLNGAERVLIKLRERHCSLPEVAGVVAEDQVIAAAVLRMANSPLYRGLQKITALPPAVNRLGVRALRALMLRESLKSAMFAGIEGAGSFAETLWRRSLASAHVMRGLSDFTNVPAEDAFLYGLLHDIGCVIVLRVAVEHLNRSEGELDLATFDYLCNESHQEFGELVAEAWKLPPELKDLISDHHTAPAEDDPLREERLQLQVADSILALLDYAPGPRVRLLDTDAARQLKLDERRGFSGFLNRLPEELAQAVGEA